MEQGKDNKESALVPPGFSTLSYFSAPRLSCYTGAISCVTVYLCGTVCCFLGCVFVLIVVLQAGRALAADVSWARSRVNRAAYCTRWTGGVARAANWSSVLPSLNHTYMSAVTDSTPKTHTHQLCWTSWPPLHHSFLPPPLSAFSQELHVH